MGDELFDILVRIVSVDTIILRSVRCEHVEEVDQRVASVFSLNSVRKQLLLSIDDCLSDFGEKSVLLLLSEALHHVAEVNERAVVNFVDCVLLEKSAESWCRLLGLELACCPLSLADLLERHEVK